MSNLTNNTTELNKILNAVNALPDAGSGEIRLQEKTVTPTKSAQKIVADSGYDGLSAVNVEKIPDEYIIPGGSKTITENGNHNVRVYEAVEVNVPVPDGYVKPVGALPITENGTYDVREIASAHVNVPDIPAVTEELSVTTNGTYEPGTGVDGYSKVVVDVPTGGGFVPPVSGALDPDEVYRTTRPSDWLPLPTPGDDEIYLLNHMPDGLDGAFTAQINHGGDCVVEIGNLVDGVFVAKETFTPAANQRFARTIQNANYGDLTADGMRQYIVRISGNKISTCQLQPGTDDSVHGAGYIAVVDAVVGVQTIITFASTSTIENNCRDLTYCRFVGNGRPTTGRNLFRFCPSLISVSLENDLQVDSMHHSFSGTGRLVAVSDKFFQGGKSYELSFYQSGIGSIPSTKFAPSSVVYMFEAANGPKTVDGDFLDTSKITSFDSFLYNNRRCTAVKKLNISSATNFNVAFKYAPLSSLTFAGDTTPGGYTIDLTYCLMSHQALVEMINSLPTATATATLQIPSNPAVSELTADEIAVATARNWTITV